MQLVCTCPLCSSSVTSFLHLHISFQKRSLVQIPLISLHAPNEGTPLSELPRRNEIFVLYPQLKFNLICNAPVHYFLLWNVWRSSSLRTTTTQMIPIHFTPNNIRLLSSETKYVWLTAHCKSPSLLHTTGYHLIYCFFPFSIPCVSRWVFKNFYKTRFPFRVIKLRGNMKFYRS